MKVLIHKEEINVYGLIELLQGNAAKMTELKEEIKKPIWWLEMLALKIEF